METTFYINTTEHLTKNSSWDDYHSKYYYPKLVYKRMLERLSSNTKNNSMYENGRSRSGQPVDFHASSASIDSDVMQESTISGAGDGRGADLYEPVLTSVDSWCSLEVDAYLRYLCRSDEQITSNDLFHLTKMRPRSSSLKSSRSKSPKKKAVRFADALGLDLELVKPFTDKETPPVLPSHILETLRKGLEEEHRGEGTRYICKCFSSPVKSNNFLQRVHQTKVVLEDCMTGDRDLTVTGFIRVANICFRKDVTVRYTINNWVTFNDISASYVLNSNDGATDKFSFTLNLPKYINVGSKLEFAIKYSALDINGVFWDNNNGKNYIIECYAKSVPMRDVDLTWMHFL